MHCFSNAFSMNHITYCAFLKLHERYSIIGLVRLDMNRMSGNMIIMGTYKI